jgi:hypothetical protein
MSRQLRPHPRCGPPIVGNERLAGVIRNWDRGEFMRSERSLQALFPNREKLTFQRCAAAATGLEML